MTTDLFSSRAAMVLRTVRLATFAIVLLSALLGLNLWAGTGGTLLGTVTDPHGAVIVGAKVAAADPATGVKQSVITDGKGFYSFQNLAVGTYDVQVEAPGFKPLRRTGVVVDVNSKIVVDAALTIGNTAETVTVSESNAHVDTVDT
ncbi:MAG TPA: carboxypeptidase-like regulatory domain-containing protein, partial [Candidatus Angelobacter sp.]|nr:carboxypeptidase-like regulatory domain-containing protein [Candidatus Angelobacter sp.]